MSASDRRKPTARKAKTTTGRRQHAPARRKPVALHGIHPVLCDLPMLEFVSPEQIGKTAVFLCSDAASQIRGIALPVDGGWTAQ